ncbi:hypothetical protein RGQ29_020850 [Quercus rubra]|uniref:Uncharacterized protein n=1 Tax=Quercus rubra TaxID=3512 RepID=A0AAN7FH97_QUERU|nr:hypothetical protein RGQ29_020850 [Quercus rubra]
MATTLPSFRSGTIRASTSTNKPDPDRRKPASANWWVPIFGWSSEPDYMDPTSTSTATTASAKNVSGVSDLESETGRNRTRFSRGCFTEEKAKQLRKKMMESSAFHDVMYHSAIASRLASDISEN